MIIVALSELASAFVIYVPVEVAGSGKIGKLQRAAWGSVSRRKVDVVPSLE